MDPRPWFLSFTAIWKEAEDFNALREKSRVFLRCIPFNHLPVKKDYWHCTVLPLLRTRKFLSGVSAEDFMLSLCENIWDSFSPKVVSLPPLRVEANSVIAFDLGTCIQFSSIDGSLKSIRDNLRNHTQAHIDQLLTRNDCLVSELEPPNRKNSGNDTYGSIARALTQESDSVRWQLKIEPKISLRFMGIYLLASDEYLSNPSAHDNARRHLIKLGLT